MNSNRRVLIFVLGSVTLYLLFSLAAYLFDFNWTPFKRVNLIADIVHEKEDSSRVPLADKQEPPIVIEKKPTHDFTLYHRPGFITNFNADTNSSSLLRFVEKLGKLKNGEKQKVRIAYFGDSMIEGDLMTQTIRALLQTEFGGSGVGYIPVTSPVSKFRQSAFTSYSGGWDDESFKSGNTTRLYLSGHLFRGHGDWLDVRDQTKWDSTSLIEKIL